MQVFQKTVFKCVNPAMNSDLLISSPGILNYGGISHIKSLSYNIYFGQAVAPLNGVCKARQFFLLNSDYLLQISQPVIDQPMITVINSGFNATASIMTANNNVFYF